MGNYQTRIIPVMPNPTQRLRDTGVNDRRPQRNRRSEKSRSCGINAILAYYNRLRARIYDAARACVRHGC